MDSTTTIFIAGYLVNIVATFHMVRKIMEEKHVEGLSFQTQILFGVATICKIFYFSLTSLNENILGWIELPLSLGLAAYTIHLFQKYKKLSLSPENSFKFTLIAIPSCFVASIFIHPGFMEDGFDFASMMIAMGSYLEAIAFVPQLSIIKKEGHIKKFMGFYVLMLSISRLLRVAFWVALWFQEGGYFWSIIISDLVYVVLVGDLVYFYLKYRHEPSIMLDR
jgi:hypothetical protein